MQPLYQQDLYNTNKYCVLKRKQFYLKGLHTQKVIILDERSYYTVIFFQSLRRERLFRNFLANTTFFRFLDVLGWKS